MLGIIGNITLHLGIIFLMMGALFAYNEKGRKLSKYFFIIHCLAVVSTLTILYILIFSHSFQYFYVWDHTATTMDNLYLFSSLWEGQEGSFLLWILFNCIVGLLVFKKINNQNKFGFLVFTGIQFFLLIMISGVSIGSFTIGASPFRLLINEFPNDPVFLQTPSFIPSEGSGLNPLLQNSWMAIHPPVIFLGFAITAVPFILYLNGLKNNNIQAVIKKSIPWSLASILVLLTGIVMGAYWAYETLNFGGYWSWDPVENAIYMPWLLSVAALHLQLVAYKTQKGYHTTIFVTLACFCMVLYSTFLTRSGILGDSSVHAFTDLGTSPLLIIFLLLSIAVSIALPVLKKKLIPSNSAFSGEWDRASFMVISAIILLLATLQVFLTTSIPVFNSIALFIGIDLNLTAPLDPIPFYTNAQAILISLLLITSMIAISSSWNKVFNPTPTFIAVCSFSIATALGLSMHFNLNLLQGTFLTSLLAVTLCNLIQWVKDVKTKKSFHHLTHMGFYILLGGIIISGAGETTTTLNTNMGTNQENLLLIRGRDNKTSTNSTFQYLGKYRKTTEGELIDTDQLAETSDEYKFLHTTLHQNGRLVEIKDQHFYYKIIMQDGEKTSTHYPTILASPKGDIIIHPEITHNWTHDCFMHLTNFSSLDPTTLGWKNDSTITLKIGEHIYFKEHKLKFTSVKHEAPVSGIEINEQDLALRATLSIDDSIAFLAPKFIIKNDLAYMLPAYNTSTGINIKLKDIDTDTGEYTFKIGQSGLDWVTLKAVQKPFMALIWAGSIIMCLGIGLSIAVKLLKRFSFETKPKKILKGWQLPPLEIALTKKLEKNEVHDQ